MSLHVNSQLPTPNSQFGSWSFWKLGVCVVLAVFLSSGVFAQNMPDPSLIHGRAIPAQELADGTVTVRVVRENIGNNAPDQQVSLTVGGRTRTATTDAQGRAEFTNLPVGGTDAIAEVTVDGEKLVSQPFRVPTSGGLRVILVAGIAKAAERKKQEEAAAAAEPPTKGIVVFGGDSRVLMQFNNDALDVYYILQIVNSSRTRVDFGAPMVIELPPGANGATALEGSSTSAVVSEDRITITGPLPSGTTTVQTAFRMPYDQANLTITQKWPAAFQQMIVGVQKVGSLQVQSPQFNSTNEVRTESGDLFVLGNGPALPAGATLTLNLSGLPYHSKTPQRVALGLAVGVLALGAWLAFGGRSKRDESRQVLVARRDTLLGQLAQIESKRRTGAADAEAQAKRRARILSELEQIYGELDEAYPGPQGGGEGVAA